MSSNVGAYEEPLYLVQKNHVCPGVSENKKIDTSLVACCELFYTYLVRTYRVDEIRINLEGVVLLLYELGGTAVVCLLTREYSRITAAGQTAAVPLPAV